MCVKWMWDTDFKRSKRVCCEFSFATFHSLYSMAGWSLKKKRGKERNRMRETNHNVLRPCPTKCARTKVSVNVSCITACCSYSSNLEKMRSIFRARYLKLSLSIDILCGNLLKALWICPCYRWRKTTSSFT